MDSFKGINSQIQDFQAVFPKTDLLKNSSEIKTQVPLSTMLPFRNFPFPI